jgi:C4-dicarboxylate transporter DctQ subunit
MSINSNKGYNWVSAFQNAFNLTEEYLLAYSVVIMATITVAQIVSRTFFHFGFGWVEQVGGHTLAMITFLGASIAVKNDKHFKMAALIENIPIQLKNTFGIITNLGCSLFFIVIVYQGFLHTHTLYKYGTKTAALSMPFFIVYLPIPLFSITISLRYGIAAYKDALALKNKEITEQ